MSKVICSDGRYTYSRELRRGALEEIDIHEVFMARSNGRIILSSASIFLLILCLCSSGVLLYQNGQHISLVGALLIPVSVIILSQLRMVKKECVVIIPSLGVQLETYYWRRLVSAGKILRPVLNEIVTPVRCYWSLAFILDGREDLMLVFQALRPPVKMLAPIWKALCDATRCEAAEPATLGIR